MNIFNKNSKEDSAAPEPFSILQGQLKAEERNYIRQRTAIQNFLTAWYRITGIKLNSIDELKSSAANPTKFYNDFIAAKNKDRLDKLKELLGPDLLADKLVETTANYPEYFNEVVHLAAFVGKPRWEMFILEDNSEIEMSPLFFTRQINKAIFYATTELDKKRLEHARKGIEWLKEKEELARLEAENLNVTASKIEHLIQRSEDIIYGPLPTGIRVDVSYDEQRKEIRKFVPDERFVVFGFHSIFSKYGAKAKEEAQKLRVLKIKDKGKTLTRLIKATDPVVEDSKTKLLPGVFVIENGRLVQSDSREEYSADNIQKEIDRLLAK
jgi:hypothetical protein